jgi:hypothetical protein
VTIVVLQPGYLPWLGFFDQLRRADVFVYYDDVQYDKHGWRNRNRIKTQTGALWLTVPVRHRGLGFPRLLEVEIEPGTPWVRKHLATLREAYAAAPFLNEYLPPLEELLRRHWQRLVDLDIAVVDLMAAAFGLTRRIERSSALNIAGARSKRLLNICRHFGATTYLTGAAAGSYLDQGLFEQHGIRVEWQHFEHPVYPQLHGEFIPYLSALDLLLNCGSGAALVLERISPAVGVLNAGGSCDTVARPR